MAAPEHSGPAGIEAVREAYEAGWIRTFRVCFADHHGLLRGRRVPAARVLDDPEEAYGFCSLAMSWDRRSETSAAIPFGALDSGSGDFYWRLDPASATICGWKAGEALAMGTTALPGGAPVPVDPRRVLARLLAENFGDRGPTVRLSIPLWPEAEEPLRPGSAAPVPTRIVRGLEASGYPLLGLGPDPGGAWQTLTLDYVGALAAADAAVVARTAGIEIAGALAPGGAAMEIEADLRRQCPDAETVEARLADLCLLLRPTVESYASGARPGPVSAVRVDGSRLRCRLASGDANPYLAVAGLLASVAVDAPSEDDPTFPTSLGEAAARFEQAAWLADWFEEEFRAHTTAMARSAEAEPIAAQVRTPLGIKSAVGA